MSATIRIPTQLRAITGTSELTATGGTVKAVIDELGAEFPDLLPRLLDESASLRRFINIYVDDEDVRFLDGLETEVPEGSRISIIPSVAGGSDDLKPPASLEGTIASSVASYPILEHPFYRAWTAGELTLDDLRDYACQYYRQVEAFPSYLQEVADRLPRGSVARRSVLENLQDEIEGEHLELWLEFAGALGLKEEDVSASVPNEETRQCIAAFREVATSGKTLAALGALYAYESQTVKTATSKLDGLADRYGIYGSGAEYFRVHSEVDVRHSEELLRGIAEQSDLDPQAVAMAQAGAETAARAVWLLLDGIERQRLQARPRLS